jgi:hypothetical protein
MRKLSDLIVSDTNKPSLVLQKILEFQNIDPRLSLENIIAATQKEWLRPVDSERWHLNETKSETEQEKFFKLFTKIGLTNAILPCQKKYDYVLFMGGDIHGMQERLHFLIQLFKNELQTKEIVFLTAERPLDSDHELVHLKDQQLKTEYDLLQFLYNKSALPELLTTTVTYVNTPNIIKNGKIYRATTPDSIIEWRTVNPQPGSALIISSQPLIGYQNAVALSLLPAFDIESVGPESSTAVTTPEYFDTLARWLYQEGKLREII